MTEIAKPYDVTPEAIAKRRAAGPPKIDKADLFVNILQTGVLLWFLVLIGAISCLVIGCASMFLL